MATTRSRQIFPWRRRRRLHFVFFSKLFYSIEVLHIHITCLHVYIVYIYLHLLPRTPDCVMAEARITEFFGETQIREEVLNFMGLGSCMPREAWRLPFPQTLQ